MNRPAKRLKSWCVQKAEVTEAFLSLKLLDGFISAITPCDRTLMCRQREAQCLFVHGYSELIVLRYNSVLCT